MATFAAFPQDDYNHSSREVGFALAGLLARDGFDMPLTGILRDDQVAFGGPASGWNVRLAHFVYVHQVNGAAQFSGVIDGEEVPVIPAAGNIPMGQARIDVVCWDPVGAEPRVVTGTPAVSPVVPDVGALAPLAEVRVNAGDAHVIDAQITDVAARSELVSSDGDFAVVPAIEAGSHKPGARVTIRRKAGVVYWEGACKPGKVEELMFVLPDGAHPHANFTIYLATDSPGTARVTVGANGNVRFNGGDTGYINLAGMSPYVGKGR